MSYGGGKAYANGGAWFSIRREFSTTNLITLHPKESELPDQIPLVEGEIEQLPLV